MLNRCDLKFLEEKRKFTINFLDEGARERVTMFWVNFHTYRIRISPEVKRAIMGVSHEPGHTKEQQKTNNFFQNKVDEIFLKYSF